MRLRALCVAAAMVSFSLASSCDLFPDDGNENNDNATCTGGPVSLTAPATVFCSVSKITATVSGTDMDTIDVTIDRDNPTLTLTIPSGPERQLVVRIYTAENTDAPFFTSPTYNFCVPDREPVSVAVKVTLKNREPSVGAIVPDGVTLPSGVPVLLTVAARDPDSCDEVKSYLWSTGFGIISGDAGSATWTPQCPGGGSCEASVAVTVKDDRGGSSTSRGTYRIGVNHPPAVTLTGADATVYPNTISVLTASASDPDGDPLTYTWRIIPPASPATLTAAGNTATWTDCNWCANSDTVEVVVSDPGGATATATIVVPAP